MCSAYGLLPRRIVLKGLPRMAAIPEPSGCCLGHMKTTRTGCIELWVDETLQVAILATAEFLVGTFVSQNF